VINFKSERRGPDLRKRPGGTVALRLWRDVNLRQQRAGAENAGRENEGSAIVWNTERCICLSIAEQDCVSRQKRAADFAADCVLVND